MDEFEKLKIAIGTKREKGHLKNIRIAFQNYEKVRAQSNPTISIIDFAKTYKRVIGILIVFGCIIAGVVLLYGN